MKKFILPLFLLVTFISCKKTIENKQNQMVINAITTGKWKVGAYQKAGIDVTSNFEGYEFKFQDDFTVDASKNSVLLQKGTWKQDTEKLTITANFSSGGEPLTLLNGIWKISKTTWTTVDASQEVNGENRQLHLDKLP